MALTSTRPYLIRAIYDWILDNQCTPYLLVDAGAPGVQVPRHVVNDGQVVLNLSPLAVDRLELGLEEIRFNARFSGQSHAVIVPVRAVQAVYAKENAQGMMFPPEEAEGGEVLDPTAATPREESPAWAEGAVPGEMLSGPNPAATEAPRPERGRPNLKIVK
jgi:stringent starvation protein B